MLYLGGVNSFSRVKLPKKFCPTEFGRFTEGVLPHFLIAVDFGTDIKTQQLYLSKGELNYGNYNTGSPHSCAINSDGKVISFETIPTGEKETSWLQNIEYLIYGIITISIITGFFIVIRRRSKKSS